MKKGLLSIVLMFMLAPVHSADAQEVIVIAHPTISINELSVAQLSAIFTGTTKIIGEKEVKLFVLSPDNPVSTSFFDKLLGTTATKFNQQWLRRTFSGDGSAPTKVSTESEIARIVASTPGAIAYIAKDGAVSAAGCKVLKVQ